MEATEYLTQIFGSFIPYLLDGKAGGDGSLVMTALNVITGMTLVAIPIYLVYIMYIAVARTAATGEAVGTRFSGYSLPLRIAIAGAMILPFADGMSPVHKLTLKVVAESSAFADGVWNKRLKAEIVSAGTPTSSVSVNSIATAGKALRILTCATSINNWSGEPLIKTVGDGIDFAKGKCGQVRWPLAFKVMPKDFVKKAKDATANLILELKPLATSIVVQSDSTRTYRSFQDREYYYPDDFVDAHAKKLREIAKRYSENISGALIAANIDPVQLGNSWINAGSQFATVSAARSKAHANVQTMQSIIQLKETTQTSAEAAYRMRDPQVTGWFKRTINKTRQGVNAIVKKASEIDTSVKINAPQKIEFTPSIACSGFDCSLEELEKHTSEWLQGAVVGRLANSGDDPYSGSIDTGNLMTSTARDLYIWQGIAAPVRSVPGVGYIAEEAQKLMALFGGKLQTGGVILAVWLPNSASVIWSFVVIAWTLAIFGALVAGPFGLLALMMPHDNSSAVPPIAKAAFMLTLAAAAMPIIALVGMTASTLIVGVVLKTVNAIFWATGIAESTSGIINTMGMITLYIYVIVGAVVITFIGLIWGTYKTIASIFSVADNSGVNESQINTVGSAGAGAAGANAGTSAMKTGAGRPGRGGGNSIKGK